VDVDVQSGHAVAAILASRAAAPRASFCTLCRVRIIAGEHRGRRISAPDGERTRPMLDRVREALFGTLGERVEGAQVLDLFAGSGSLALEALSRGAERAVLIERNPTALDALQANIEE